ncbi:MAG: hypothetical protein ABJ327_02475 [Litoreibacter sp.]
MIRHIFNAVITAFSLTLMLLTIVYTEQIRIAREKAPKRIGEETVQIDFLTEYAHTRQELLIGFLRERFPELDLPEPAPLVENTLSLRAFRERNSQTSHSFTSPNR